MSSLEVTAHAGSCSHLFESAQFTYTSTKNSVHVFGQAAAVLVTFPTGLATKLGLLGGAFDEVRPLARASVPIFQEVLVR